MKNLRIKIWRESTYRSKWGYFLKIISIGKMAITFGIQAFFLPVNQTFGIKVYFHPVNQTIAGVPNLLSYLRAAYREHTGIIISHNWEWAPRTAPIILDWVLQVWETYAGFFSVLILYEIYCRSQIIVTDVGPFVTIVMAPASERPMLYWSVESVTNLCFLMLENILKNHFRRKRLMPT